MLPSVLAIRDRFLKPGGAVLPDIASMYIAGFGEGGTSLPFWREVYGFDMSCVGKALLDEASNAPIVDSLKGEDVVTTTCCFKTFDLTTMSAEEADFTSTFSLKARQKEEDLGKAVDDRVWCYGVVLWFDTDFSERFCKENPVRLSTSPFEIKTHWAQTLLTLREPIALARNPQTTVGGLGLHKDEGGARAPRIGGGQELLVGTKENPAVEIGGRISIVRSLRHRSIDISVEVEAKDASGFVRKWPAQIYNM